MNNQRIKILEYLQRGNTITQDDAKKLFQCSRLAARIGELRKQGHAITTLKESYLNDEKRKVSYARYILESEVAA